MHMRSILRIMKYSFTRFPMHQIFAAPSHIAIFRVLNQLNQGISGRELARRAGINDRTCRLALQRMENLNLVEYLGSGKTILFRLNRKNYFAKNMFFYLFEKENEYFDTVIYQLKDYLLNKCVWSCIYGSVVEKTDTSSSDLDVLIIVKNLQSLDTFLENISVLVSAVFVEFGLSLSPIVLLTEQWMNDNQFKNLKKDVFRNHIHLTGMRL